VGIHYLSHLILYFSEHLQLFTQVLIYISCLQLCFKKGTFLGTCCFINFCSLYRVIMLLQTGFSLNCKKNSILKKWSKPTHYGFKLNHCSLIPVSYCSVIHNLYHSEIDLCYACDNLFHSFLTISLICCRLPCKHFIILSVYSDNGFYIPLPIFLANKLA